VLVPALLNRQIIKQEKKVSDTYKGSKNNETGIYDRDGQEGVSLAWWVAFQVDT
jgi:hypothetical protein